MKIKQQKITTINSLQIIHLGRKNDIGFYYR